PPFLLCADPASTEIYSPSLHDALPILVYGDSDGKARTARRPIAGADKVARFAVGLAQKYGDELFTNSRPVLVNGELGLLLAGSPQVAPRVLTVAVRDGKAAAIFDVVNPEKLTRVPW